MSCRSEHRTIVKQLVSLALVVAMWANFVCVASYARELPGTRPDTARKTNSSLTVKASDSSVTKAAPKDKPASTEVTSRQRVQLNEAYGKLPLRFEINKGQMDSQVQFVARGSGYNLFLTPVESVMVLSKSSGVRSRVRGARVEKSLRSSNRVNSVIRTKLIGSRTNPDIIGLEELAGKSNYFIGNDPAKWQVGVSSYARVKYAEVYPGIDLVYYGNQARVEHDFIVAPGSEPQAIKLSFDGARRLRIDRKGELVLSVKGGELRQSKPIAYQVVEGQRREITSRYRLTGKHQVGFEVGAYDKSRPLVIDPVLVYSTYLGGSLDDLGWDIAVDSAGNAYITGQTSSTNFPTSSAFDATSNGGADGFVTKLNAAGSAFIYSTYIGGSGTDRGSDIAVDSLGNAYVTGSTASSNFPVANAFQSAYAGARNSGTTDAFVIKLNPAGSAFVFSTYLGGSTDDGGIGIALGPSNTVYVTGGTNSTNFPLLNAFQSVKAGGTDAFVTKFSSAGNTLVYSTYLGGTATSGTEGGDVVADIAVDSAGSAYVTGQTYSTNFPVVNAIQSFRNGGNDAFVTKFSPAGNSLIYSTYLGGSYTDPFIYLFGDSGQDIAVDAAGNAYVIGETYSFDFPTANAYQSFNASSSFGLSDAFVTVLNSTGTGFIFSTYLGGESYDGGDSIALGSSGEVYVVGSTQSTNFPTTDAVQNTNNGGMDAFVTKFNNTGSGLVYSTYLGGSATDTANAIALDSADNAYIAGYTASSNYPTANALRPANGGGNDVFVSKITNLNGYSISGRVADDSGIGRSGVTVSITGTQSTSTLTDANGNYSFANLPAAGNYTLNPSLAAFTFVPTSQTVNSLSSNQTVNFTIQIFKITGHVTDGTGAAVSGATLSLTGAQTASTQTDSTGSYSFSNLPIGNYTVTPAKSDDLLTYTFAPPSRSYTNMSSSQVADFTATTSIQSMLFPSADAYVQDGTNAGVNFGTATPLKVQTGSQVNVGTNLDAYFKYDLSGVPQNISNAKLRISASLSAAGSISSSVYSVADTSWIESGTGSITWNNRPARSATPLSGASITVASTTLTTFDIDVTSYVKSEKAAGRDLVSLALHDPSASTIFINVNSREALANKPQLIVLASANANNAPSVTLSSPANGATFGAPANIALSATATDDGSVSRVDFYSGTSLIGSSTTPSGSTYSSTWTNVPAGSYNIYAVATDNSGFTASSNTSAITVGAANNLPAVTITSPLTGTTFSAGANISISAMASDTNGTISKVEFFAGANLIGTATVPVNGQYSTTWANVNTGSYSLTAKATDNANGTTTSGAVNINVVAQAGLSPTADAYVRDGASATTNFGTATTLQTQSSTAGNNRETYLKFDLTTVTGITKATVRLYGSLSDATASNVPASIYSVATTTWTESGSGSITWNTKPASGTSSLATTVIRDNAPRWYEFDVTSYLQAEKAAGRNVVSLAVKNTAQSSPFASFNSKEAANNQPQLILWSTQQRNALLVVGSATLNTGDTAARTRLQNLGYTVTVKVAGSNNNASVKPTDADGKTLVVISSTVVPANVTNKLRNIPVPVVNWEFDILDDMGLTGLVSGTDFGTGSTTQTQLNISGPAHQMAAGLTGTQTVVTTATNFTWGKPNTNAARIAALTNDATRFAIFGYAEGSAMPGLEAPARRVALFLTDTTAASFNANGGALFDATVKWATEVITAPTIITLTPASGPTGTVVTISGLNFGAAQGTSTLTFNSLVAAATTWGDQNIVVAVPAFAITGPVVLTVNGVASNGVIFAVGEIDSDGDGLPDNWELQYFGNLNQGANGDPDGDGVTNLQEYQQGRNPTKSALVDDGDFVNLKVHTPLEPQP
jgi:Big-like domain-containing protein/carboxypeptidase family protein/beta-propeller repeat-containing protein/IPT/TIG domain-containing protein